MDQVPLACMSAWDGTDWLYYITLDRSVLADPRVQDALDTLQRVCRAARRGEDTPPTLRVVR